MARREVKKSFDMLLFITAIALWIIGNALVYSATITHTSGPLAGVFQQQIIWTAIGIVIILIMVSVPPSLYYKLAPVFYVATILLLVAVLVGGVSTKGAGRWLMFGGIKIQPSEFAKIGLLLMLARYFTKNEISLQRPMSLVMPAIIILIPFVLVVGQPDLSTTLAMIAMSLPIFYWSGMTLVEIIYLISPGISAVLAIAPLIIAFVGSKAMTLSLGMTSDFADSAEAFAAKSSQMGVTATIPWAIFFVLLCFLLHKFPPKKLFVILVITLNLIAASAATLIWENSLSEYQKTRVISFINPQIDPRGSGYQVIQSIIAIGSGKIYGKGFLEGTQVNLAFLPEQHTDFIFSVLGEQFGFFGCTAVILLFFLLVARALYTLRNIRERFVNIIIVGAVSLLVYHIFVNIAMVIGLMPVTGLPLPFLSYGGSFTLTLSMLMGLILNARANSE